MHWLFLGLAIVGEVIGTTALKASDGFTKWGYVGLTAAGYIVAFYFLGLALKTIPMGVAYAVWSGVGVALVAIAGATLFGQKLDLAGFCGIGLIMAGVIVLNTLSKSAAH